jgi:hypothetical protein
MHNSDSVISGSPGACACCFCESLMIQCHTECETQPSPVQDLCSTTALPEEFDASICATCGECEHAKFEDPASLIQHVQTHVEPGDMMHEPVTIFDSFAMKQVTRADCFLLQLLLLLDYNTVETKNIAPRLEELTDKLSSKVCASASSVELVSILF